MRETLNEHHVSPNSFDYLDKALHNFGYSVNAKKQIYKLISSILHLGDIEFYDSEIDGGSKIREESFQSLQYAACLMNVTAIQLQQTLLKRLIRMNNKKEEM